ncbi:MAG: CoA transferase, partial [Vicinamibacterales bacterium]
RHLNSVGERARPEHAGPALTYPAARGLLTDRLPAPLRADLLGAEQALSAALLLLAGPAGGRAEVGLADSLDALSAPARHGLTGAGELLGGGLAAYGVYPAREGHVAVAALEPHFRRRLYDALDRPIDAPLADAFTGRTAGDWEAWARERDLPIVAVRAR